MQRVMELWSFPRSYGASPVELYGPIPTTCLLPDYLSPILLSKSSIAASTAEKPKNA
jgi:hypothetical protein